MRYLMIAFALCALPVVGCAEDAGVEGGSGGEGGAAGAGGVAGTGGMAGTVGTRQYGLRFSRLEADESSAVIEGVELCQADGENCATSNEFGIAVIDVPVDQEITFTAEKEGYASWVFGDVSNDDADLITNRRLYTDAQMQAVTEQLGGTYPWTAGMVGLVRFPTHSEGGVMFIPVGDTADEVGDSFYYDGENGTYGTKHAASGPYDGVGYLLELGDGGFMSVTEGEQVFELGGTGGDCPVSWGWPGDTPSQMRVPVRTGYRTYGSWNCEIE